MSKLPESREMPDRIIRDEILESKRFLGLHSDTERIAYMALLLKADALGNHPAEPWRLWRLWRDFAIRSEEDVAKVVDRLVDADLIRLYEADGTRFLHVPRFRQRLRYVKRIYPQSPWDAARAENETPKKQTVAENSPGDSPVVTGSAPDSHTRSEGKGSEVKGSEEKKVPRARKRALTPLPLGFSLSPRVRDWAEKGGYKRMPERLEHFVGRAKAKDYRYADWDEGFMEAVRRDWAGLDTAGGKKITNEV